MKIPEKPGSFLSVLSGARQAEVSPSFNYRYATSATRWCSVVELRNGNAERTELVDLLVDGV